MARPKKEVDEVMVKKLASIFCTVEQIASMVGCSKDTLERRFAAIIKEGRENGRTSLLKKQFEMAMTGNITMLIWLGKQHLGQSDKVEQETKTNRTINLKYSFESEDKPRVEEVNES